MVDFKDPGRLIGKNTVGSMQAGLYYGTIAMIDGIVEQMVAEMGQETKTVATGGHAGLITRGSKWVKTADEDLTLEGLRMIWEMNQRG
jgi:type III pantothenate kinase